MPEIGARNIRKGIARIVFYVVRAMPIARQRSDKHPYELLRDGIFRGVRMETM
jgi:hypothetical protein